VHWRKCQRDSSRIVDGKLRLQTPRAHPKVETLRGLGTPGTRFCECTGEKTGRSRGIPGYRDKMASEGHDFKTKVNQHGVRVIG